MAELLKGAAVVAALNEKMTAEITNLKSKGVSPTLAILRVGERPDDISYEKGAMKRCETVGVAVKNIVLPADVTQDVLIQNVESLNNDKGVHGVLIFRPLPKHLDEEAVRKALKPEKDIDGITDGSLAGVFTGNGNGFPPCTAQACMEILDFYKVNCAGKRAVVIGRSLVVGKPAAVMLMGKNTTVTVCHTKTVDMPAVARTAEILIVAAGKANAVTKEYLAPGQIVVDVGINMTADGKLCGDVKFDDAEPIVGAITPVPGGVGTVTTSVLVSHVVEAAKKLL
ncbi:methylenetetrahydrofolate dehydrogenase (NADP+) / methenyltetrahydrofolate cyclohydrolase [Sporobacter termitidis DSM 10068]|uniref:Bifunctional protein FolD n=1 Tax=Sporobacter termitidis DSM 10068 TaxID=1123282 RepID=A0A1M5TD65_9FIRM|nr:bifunctional 5,10-methylenetetrahydrofolate dehydrogenase/5,10-methenyltetrahydrofolate cyclohydrolase [Sporobacter termitidis]SHH48727.1 methylenetetrahydrofolate dehydrogenase (NADP+) / methenyltetrahydrofolate cyclohydrolase [Sporobacter termitidis DSM 10068]